MSEEAGRPGPWEGLAEVAKMAWPIMLGAMSFVVMDFVDKVFVSRLGVENLAAVGSAGIWSYTMGVFFVGIVACVSTFASQSLGRGALKNCSAYAWQGVYVSIFAGVMGLGLLPLAGPLFQTMGHEADVTELELIYFRIRIFGFAFIAWQAALASFFQAVNRSVVPMYAALIGNVCNIALDYVLIFGKLGFPAMGIAGAATATVISILFQAAIMQAVFMGARTHREYQSRATWRIDWTKGKDLFTIGWPAGLSALLDVAGWSIFTSYIVGAFGTVQLAAHTAAINFMHLMFIPALALNQATTALVGQWLGRGSVPTAKARAYTATKIGIVIMISMGIMLAIFGTSLMRIFSDDPTVIDLGHTLLILAAIFAGFDAVNIVLSGALRGAGDTRWIMVAMLIGSYAVSLPLAWTFAVPVGLGARGAWIGATIYIILLSGVFLWRFHGEKWRDIRIFSEDKIPEAGPAEVAVLQEKGVPESN